MDLPFITVIIPVRPGGKVRALASLAGVDYPRDKFEILVTEGHQPSIQRNVAARQARGGIIYFLDDDSRPTPGLFKTVVERYRDPKISAVGGPILTPDTDGFIQKCFGLSLASMFGGSSIRARYKRVGPERSATENDLILANLSFRRDVFMGAGGFNENLYPNEENELMNRLHAEGHVFLYVPDAFLYRSQRPSYRAYLRQVFTYGRGRMDQNYAHPEGFKALHLAPSIFLLYLASLGFVHNFVYMWPLLLYITLDLAFSAASAVEGGCPASFFVMPFMFLSLHLGYGAGFIWGLVKGMRSGGRVSHGDSSVHVRKVEPGAVDR